MPDFNEVDAQFAHAPSELYKYRSLDPRSREHTERIIVKRELYWSPASKLDDSLDCNPLPRLTGRREEKQRWMRKSLRSVFPEMPKAERKELAAYWANRPPGEFEVEMAKKIDQGRALIGVCSLSSDPANYRLWQEYADDHRGICLRFSDAAADQYDKSLENFHFSLALPVSYQAERPQLPIWGNLSGKERCQKLALTKTTKWEYQKEWRLIDVEFTGNRAFPPAALSGVIFGAAISDGDRETVIGWTKAKNLFVEFLQAYEDGSRVWVAPYQQR